MKTVFEVDLRVIRQCHNGATAQFAHAKNAKKISTESLGFAMIASHIYEI